MLQAINRVRWPFVIALLITAIAAGEITHQRFEEQRRMIDIQRARIHALESVPVCEYDEDAKR